MSSCIFCQIVHGHIPSVKVYEDDEVLAFRDINPQAPVHVLIIPKKHIAMITDLDENEHRLMGKLIAAANQVAGIMKVEESGFRLVINNGRDGGQDVFHIHVHFLAGRRLKWPPG